METEGIKFALGGGAVTALAGVLGAWIKARYGGRTRIENDPVNVRKEDKYITRGECKQYRCAISERMGEEHALLREIVETLKENDAKSEARTRSTHERIDPLLRELGSVRGKMDLLEKAAINATMGGKKQ